METLRRGFDALWARIAYIEYFGATLRNVPANVPHENGTMTIAALTHILFPRLIYPDKPALPSDTVVTARYTGLPLSVRDDTTISIGYPGEFYIDFGVTGLLGCMGILGFFYGKATRVVQRSFKSPLVAYGATISLLMPGFMFETALPKAIGGVMTSFIILVVMGRTVVPFVVGRILSNFAVRRKMPASGGVPESVWILTDLFVPQSLPDRMLYLVDERMSRKYSNGAWIPAATNVMLINNKGCVRCNAVAAVWPRLCEALTARGVIVNI